jgi:adenylate cyclase
MEERLVACLYADVSGYCRLINRDVGHTIRTLRAYRTLMAGLVMKFAGRVVDVAGDSLLAEFPTAGGAVECAVEIQRELAARNATLPPDRRVEFRIGIELGQVVVDRGRLYGDAVNIAARVQEAGAPRTIRVAESAYGRINGSPSMRLDYLGEHTAKNMERPLRVYQVADQ